MDDISLLIRRARRGNASSLDISGRKLTTWPADVLRMNTLEQLNLSNNSLTSIPTSISELSNLRRLNLSNNLISALPPSLLQLPLIYLNLQGNPINLGVLTSGTIQQAVNSNRDESAVFVEQRKMPVRPRSALPQAHTDISRNFAPAQVKLEDCKLFQTISQGGFSVVQRGEWRGAEVAIKVIVDPVITDQLRDEFNNEVKMLSYLRHPSTILLMGVNNDPPHLAVLTEFASNGSLFDLLHKTRDPIPQEIRMKIVRQVASVFFFYHSAGVVHRDLKSMNVLLDQNNNVKICDFGLARFGSELNRGTMQFSGTPSYMAPQLFRKQAIDEKVDVYAFGTLLWEILSRQVPFDGLDPSDIREKTLRGDNALDVPYSVPKNLELLVNDCRAMQTTSRPSFADIVSRLS